MDFVNMVDSNNEVQGASILQADSNKTGGDMSKDASGLTVL